MKSIKKPVLLKKISISFFIFSILFSSSIFIYPQKANALFGAPIPKPVIVIGGPGTIQDTISAIANKVTSFATLGSYTKEYVLDPIAINIARRLISQMTGSILQWINTGFEGKPTFVNNPDSFFTNIVRDETNTFLIELVADQTNSPFALDIAYSIMNPRGGSYTLYDDIVQNCRSHSRRVTDCPPPVGDSYQMEYYTRQFLGGDFALGGWGSWYSLTQYPQNNVYGAYINAQYELQRRQRSQIDRYQQEIQQSGGFLGIRGDCLEYVDYSDISADAECKEYEIVTPGRAVADYLGASITSPIHQGELVDDFKEGLSLIVEALVNRVTLDGITGLSKAVAGGGNNNSGSFTNQLVNNSTNYTGSGGQSVQTAIADITLSIKNESDFRDAKNNTLGTINSAENNLATLEACYQSIISSDFSYASSNIVISGRNFASTTLQEQIIPRKASLSSQISSVGPIITSLEDIKDRLEGTANNSTITTAIQEYESLKTSAVLHSSADVSEAQIESGDIAQGISIPVNSRLDECKQIESGSGSDSSSL